MYFMLVITAYWSCLAYHWWRGQWTFSSFWRTIRREVLVQPEPGRAILPGRPRGLQRERTRGVHGAAHPHQPWRPERGDGQDLLQPRDQRAVGQVPRARHRDDHHQVREVRAPLDLLVGLCCCHNYDDKQMRYSLHNMLCTLFILGILSYLSVLSLGYSLHHYY